MEMALRPFHENEHRLFIVHRAAQLMDDTKGWTWAEPLFRAAVQYLVSRPDIRQSEITRALWDTTERAVHASIIESAVETRIQRDYGDEPRLSRTMASLPRAEVISLTGAEMLRRSGFDSNAVTGTCGVPDLLQDPTVEPQVHALAMDAALLGPRTFRQQSCRSGWCKSPERPDLTP